MEAQFNMAAVGAGGGAPPTSVRPSPAAGGVKLGAGNTPGALTSTGVGVQRIGKVNGGAWFHGCEGRSAGVQRTVSLSRCLHDQGCNRSCSTSSV